MGKCDARNGVFPARAEVAGMLRQLVSSSVARSSADGLWEMVSRPGWVSHVALIAEGERDWWLVPLPGLIDAVRTGIAKGRIGLATLEELRRAAKEA